MKHLGSVRFSPQGLSLLEVILSLAILGGSIVVIGELVRSGVNNSRSARDMTQAQLLCESKLAEITAGVIYPDPVSEVAFQVNDETWHYTIEVNPTGIDGLLALQVTVSKPLTGGIRPVTFTLARWLKDPYYVPPTSDSSSTTGSSSSISSGR